MSELIMKSVSELLSEEFVIPDYQRGYRWTEIEVRNLLNDVKSFFEKTEKNKDVENSESFYCMQPLVVCKSPKYIGKWEVIDGQQRLTTISLILRYIKQIYEKKVPRLFTISYETRPKSQEYIQELSEQKKDENIDFSHMYRAYKEIETFFAEFPDDDIKFLSYLLNSKSTGKNIQFIWYDVTDETASQAIVSNTIFERLNVGKIPLTNAELIKALFLNQNYLSKNPEMAKEIQSRIALDWDRIEKKLQQNDFWYFIYGNNQYKYSTRIEFLFDILKNNKHMNDEEPRFTFNQYYKTFESSSKKSDIATEEWGYVLDLFGVFENWFEDRVLYHLVGFNTAMGTHISTIRDILKNSSSNRVFKEQLFERTKMHGETRIDFTSLEYGDKDIPRALLLFNVLSMLKNKKSEDRFPFSYYHLQKGWDIEHVSPQTEQDITGKDRFNWILVNLSYFTGVEIPIDKQCFESNEFLKSVKQNLPTKKEELEIVESLIKLLEEKEDESIKTQKVRKILESLSNYFKGETGDLQNKNLISNLVLLDSGTNRMYKNAFFPIKRKWIIEREKNGVFIPIGTKNVFLKAYSNNLSNLSAWTENDAESYLKVINTVLNSSKEAYL